MTRTASNCGNCSRNSGSPSRQSRNARKRRFTLFRGKDGTASPRARDGQPNRLWNTRSAFTERSEKKPGKQARLLPEQLQLFTRFSQLLPEQLQLSPRFSRLLPEQLQLS